AHDFNNLLTAILGETQLLLLDPSLIAHSTPLSVIERAALDGATAIRRIQDSTRVRTDREFILLDARDVLGSAVDITRRRAEADNIIVSSFVPGRAMFVRGVPAELREVVTNILIN